MANNIQFINGTLTTTGGEDFLFTAVADKYFATWIFCHNMIAGDTITIKMYAKDINANITRIYINEALSGAQTAPAWYLHLIPTSEYKVSLTRTAGVDRAYTWVRAEI